MNEEKKEKILSKLKKLMDLKESARNLGNEGEANAAAAGISRLLIEYNLSEEDIPTEERVKNPVVMEMMPYECRGHRGEWYTRLIIALCKYNLCKCTVNSVTQWGKTKAESFGIIGRRSNVDVVLYLAGYLNAQFQSIGRMKYKRLSRDYKELHSHIPMSQAQYMTSFLYGCVVGLVGKYDEMNAHMGQECQGTTELVATSHQEIDAYIASRMKIDGNRTARKPQNIQATAYYSGVKTGKDVNLQSGLEGKDSRNKGIV
ncbi:MAG: hypothetical protein ACI36Z_01355 [Alloprevotella sp.]